LDLVWLFCHYFVWNLLSPRNVDRLSKNLVLEVLWNGREGGWCGSRVGKIPSVVPASNSSERGNPDSVVGLHLLSSAEYPICRGSERGKSLERSSDPKCNACTMAFTASEWG